MTVNPRDAATLAKITNAVERIERWKVPLRKERKKIDAPRQFEESEQHYDLATLTAITKCKKMWQDFESIQSTATKRPLTVSEIRVATAAVAVTMLFSSAQRPSAILGVTIDEVENKRWRDGVWIISVRQHKTSEKGPAMITLTQEDMNRLSQYVDNVRQQMDPTAVATQAWYTPNTVHHVAATSQVSADQVRHTGTIRHRLSEGSSI